MKEQTSKNLTVETDADAEADADTPTEINLNYSIDDLPDKLQALVKQESKRLKAKGQQKPVNTHPPRHPEQDQ